MGKRISFAAAAVVLSASALLTGAGSASAGATWEAPPRDSGATWELAFAGPSNGSMQRGATWE